MSGSNTTGASPLILAIPRSHNEPSFQHLAILFHYLDRSMLRQSTGSTAGTAVALYAFGASYTQPWSVLSRTTGHSVSLVTHWMVFPCTRAVQVVYGKANPRS